MQEYKCKKNLTNIVSRWFLEFGDYNFTLHHIKRSENCLADYLSRDPMVPKDVEENKDVEQNNVI